MDSTMTLETFNKLVVHAIDYEKKPAGDLQAGVQFIFTLEDGRQFTGTLDPNEGFSCGWKLRRSARSDSE